MVFCHGRRAEPQAIPTVECLVSRKRRLPALLVLRFRNPSVHDQQILRVPQIAEREKGHRREIFRQFHYQIIVADIKKFSTGKAAIVRLDRGTQRAVLLGETQQPGTEGLDVPSGRVPRSAKELPRRRHETPQSPSRGNYFMSLKTNANQRFKRRIRYLPRPKPRRRQAAHQ
jgi:hypothetical protein